MFSYIKGILDEINEDIAVVENNGIGYEIAIPLRQINTLPQRGSEVKIFTYLQVKEDGLSLYGFLDKESLALFKKLLSVSGVGPKSALGILSLFSPNELKVAILSQDSKAIAKAPGIGIKSAQRIIIDLKDKVDILDVVPVDDLSVSQEVYNDSAAKQEALLALNALGYSDKEAKKALSNIEESAELTVEDYLKMALKYMG